MASPKSKYYKAYNSQQRSNSVMFNEKFINLTYLSIETGISLAMISYVISGRRDPSIRTAHKIAKALGMSIGGFLEALEFEKKKLIIETELKLQQNQ